MTGRNTFLTLALAGAVIAGAATHASAAPLSSSSLRTQAQQSDSNIVNVQYRGRSGYRGDRGRGGFGLGLAAGAVVGAATAPLWAFGAPGYGYDESDYPRGTYNRYSGQFNRSCVIDDGYGRTRPCNSGSGA